MSYLKRRGGSSARQSRYPGSSLRAANVGASSSYIGRLPANYGGQQTGGIRHEASFATDGFEGTVPSMLPSGEYFIIENMKMRRSFSGTDDDTPNTPTVSNNLASVDIMNGSSASNFTSNIRIKNEDTNDTVTLDVYNIALSWYEALIWDTINTNGSPLSFNVAVATPDQRGNVTAKLAQASEISVQDWNNLKFQQHYMQHLGAVTIGNADGNNVIEFRQSRIPPKCRRSQTGMYWATLFLFDSTKNDQATATLNVNQELKFDEHPSDQRLPYLT